jgi:hypothetical protein
LLLAVPCTCCRSPVRWPTPPSTPLRPNTEQPRDGRFSGRPRYGTKNIKLQIPQEHEKRRSNSSHRYHLPLSTIRLYFPSSRPISHLCIPTFGPPTNTSFDQIPHLPSCQALHSPLPAALARVRQLYPALSPATGLQSRGQRSQSIRRLSTRTRRA